MSCDFVLKAQLSAAQRAVQTSARGVVESRECRIRTTSIITNFNIHAQTADELYCCVNSRKHVDREQEHRYRRPDVIQMT